METLGLIWRVQAGLFIDDATLRSLSESRSGERTILGIIDVMSLQGHSLVDVNRTAGWPVPLATQIEHLASRYDSDTELIDGQAIGACEDGVRALLAGYRVQALHCTRLLDSEVENLRAEGLRPLDEHLVKARLDAAYQVGQLSRELRDQLARKNLLTHPRPMEDRRDLVCMIAARSALDEAPQGVWRPLSHWGGEALFFYHGGDPEVVRQLQSIGRPTIVVAGVDLSRPTEDVPGTLAHDFIRAFKGLRGVGSSIHHRGPIPPEAIEDILQPGTAAYDRHTALPRR